MMTTLDRIRQQVPRASLVPRGRQDSGHGFGHHGINHGDHDHDDHGLEEIGQPSNSDAGTVQNSIIPLTMDIESTEDIVIENAKNSLTELIGERMQHY